MCVFREKRLHCSSYKDRSLDEHQVGEPKLLLNIHVRVHYSSERSLHPSVMKRRRCAGQSGTRREGMRRMAKELEAEGISQRTDDCVFFLCLNLLTVNRYVKQRKNYRIRQLRKKGGDRQPSTKREREQHNRGVVSQSLLWEQLFYIKQRHFTEAVKHLNTFSSKK